MENVKRSGVLLPLRPAVLAFPLFVAAAVGCDAPKEAPKVAAEEAPSSAAHKEPEALDTPDVVDAVVADDVGATPDTPEKPVPLASPTPNHLPKELDNVRVGMTLVGFREARDTYKMEAKGYDMAGLPDLEADDSNEVFMAKLDAMDQSLRKQESPNWQGERGLYYLTEKLGPEPLKSATYQFSDGSLKEIIVYYDTPQTALAVAAGLRGAPVEADERWTLPERGDTPELKAWVYKDRYVVRTAVEPDPVKPAEDDASDPEKTLPTSFSIGPLRKGSFSPVATLSFDAKNRGTLVIVEAGEDAERLQVAWKKISKQDVVHYKGHGGSKGRERVRVSVERTQPKFPRAAAEALSQETGMFASAR